MLEKDYRILISNLGNGRSIKREEARAAIEAILNKKQGMMYCLIKKVKIYKK